MLDNFSVEDFLFMHRQMIARVDARLEQIGDPTYPKVEGWPSIPEPRDIDYPVPPAWTEPDDQDFTEFIRAVKSDEAAVAKCSEATLHGTYLLAG